MSYISSDWASLIVNSAGSGQTKKQTIYIYIYIKTKSIKMQKSKILPNFGYGIRFSGPEK